MIHSVEYEISGSTITPHVTYDVTTAMAATIQVSFNDGSTHQPHEYSSVTSADGHFTSDFGYYEITFHVYIESDLSQTIIKSGNVQSTFIAEATIETNNLTASYSIKASSNDGLELQSVTLKSDTDTKSLGPNNDTWYHDQVDVYKGSISADRSTSYILIFLVKDPETYSTQRYICSVTLVDSSSF